MTVALFIPCYIDQFYPHVAIATLQLLEKYGCDVHYPLNQTCCGQPMANSGFANLSKGCDENFIKNFAGYDYIVSPSGSCVLHVKEHVHDHDHSGNGHAATFNGRIFELTEFLVEVLKVDRIEASFPYRVGLHTGCHGQRGLHLSSMSERMDTPFSIPEKLLRQVKGLDLVKPVRWDECCGFGGTFCVTEEAVSAQMGKDLVERHLDEHVQYLTSSDMSCLMHLEGVLRRKKSAVKVVHIAEILNAQ